MSRCRLRGDERNGRTGRKEGRPEGRADGRKDRMEKRWDRRGEQRSRVWTSFVPPCCSNRLKEGTPKGGDFIRRLPSHTHTQVTLSNSFALSYSSAGRNGTLGNGQKSCDDYGFIQCVKRLPELRRRRYVQRQTGGPGRAGGIVAPRLWSRRR